MVGPVSEARCIVCNEIIPYQGRGRPPSKYCINHRHIAHKLRKHHAEEELPDETLLDDASLIRALAWALRIEHRHLSDQDDCITCDLVRRSLRIVDMRTH